MKACFMGLGYIGLPTAIIAAKHGVEIAGVDINAQVVEVTNQGKLHIIEPGMEESERGYWRDVGTIDAYWQANMDLLAYDPELNLYSKEWPLRTFNYNYPPAKFIWEELERRGMATNSMVSEGCVISGGSLSRCILSPKVRINSFSSVVDSILMENVNVGRHSHISKAIIDKNVDIPA